MIYAICGEGINKVKFGVTINQSGKDRLATLQIGSPVTLRLIAICDWEDRYERVIHRFLAPHHSHGEWFHISAETNAVINAMKTGKVEKLHDVILNRQANNRRLKRIIEESRKLSLVA